MRVRFRLLQKLLFSAMVGVLPIRNCMIQGTLYITGRQEKSFCGGAAMKARRGRNSRCLDPAKLII
jgi:hypothetical protein